MQKADTPTNRKSLRNLKRNINQGQEVGLLTVTEGQDHAAEERGQGHMIGITQGQDQDQAQGVEVDSVEGQGQ